VTIADTKKQLLHVLGDPENRVIALTGKWGTGKTHLWKDIKEDSNEAYMQKALYASLFGLSSIDQVKRKLMETAIYGSESKSKLVKGLRAFVKEGAFAASKQYQSVNVINDLTISLMAPQAVSEQADRHR